MVLRLNEGWGGEEKGTLYLLTVNKYSIVLLQGERGGEGEGDDVEVLIYIILMGGMTKVFN